MPWATSLPFWKVEGDSGEKKGKRDRGKKREGEGEEGKGDGGELKGETERKGERKRGEEYDREMNKIYSLSVYKKKGVTYFSIVTRHMGHGSPRAIKILAHNSHVTT